MAPFVYLEACTVLAFGPSRWLGVWNLLDVITYMLQVIKLSFAALQLLVIACVNLLAIMLLSAERHMFGWTLYVQYVLFASFAAAHMIL